MTNAVLDEKKEKAFASKIRGALMYPGFVIVATFVVSLATIWFTFPKLVAVFKDVGGTLPLTTRIILWIGDFVGKHGLWFIPSLIIFVGLMVWILFFYKKTKVIGENIMFRFPISQTVMTDLELARFGYVLGTLMKAGISVPDALVSLQESTSFNLYRAFYKRVEERVVEGDSFYKALSSVPKYQRYIPSHIARLIVAGEMSGALPETMLTIGETYEGKIEGLTRDVGALLEPVIIITVGLVVAVIAFGVITPIYGLVDQIH